MVILDGDPIPNQQEVRPALTLPADIKWMTGWSLLVHHLTGTWPEINLLPISSTAVFVTLGAAWARHKLLVMGYSDSMRSAVSTRVLARLTAACASTAVTPRCSYWARSFRPRRRSSAVAGSRPADPRARSSFTADL